MKSKDQQKALDARKKLFIQLVGIKQSDNMTRTYMAMKQSDMLNDTPKPEDGLMKSR